MDVLLDRVGTFAMTHLLPNCAFVAAWLRAALAAPVSHTTVASPHGGLGAAARLLAPLAAAVRLALAGSSHGALFATFNSAALPATVPHAPPSAPFGTFPAARFQAPFTTAVGLHESQNMGRRGEGGRASQNLN